MCFFKSQKIDKWLFLEIYATILPYKLGPVDDYFGQGHGMNYARGLIEMALIKNCAS